MSDRIINSVLLHDYNWKVTQTFSTNISTMIGGGEQRRARWELPIRKFSLPYNNKTMANSTLMRKFHFDHKGSYESFLFFDSSCRIEWTITAGYKVLSGSDVTAIYLYDHYIKPTNLTAFPATWATTSPNFTTDIIVTSGTAVRTTNMTIDSDIGKITFAAPYPQVTDVLKVKYEHYIRVRFATDDFELTEPMFNLGSFNIDLLEVR